MSSIRASCWPAARSCVDGDGDDDGLVDALRDARPARPLAVLGRPADRERRSGDPAGDVGLHRAARRVPGLDHAGAQPAQRARGGGVEQRQALPGRPRRGRCADACRRSSSRRGRRCRAAQAARSWSSRRSVPDRSAPTGSPTAAAAAQHAAALQDGGRTVLVQPYDPRVDGGRDRAGVPRRRAVARLHQGADAAAAGRAAGARRVGHLRRGDADARRPGLRAVGRRPRRARRAPPRTWASPRSELLYARVDVIGGAGRPACCWNWSWSNRRWAGVSSTTTNRRAAAARLRAAASSQPWSGSGSVRCRIDAHSAAVAAVQAAAPATCSATSTAGTPVKNCTDADQALQQHQADQHDEPPHAPAAVRRTASRPTPRPISRRQIGDQQRRVRVHQRDDLHLQARHRCAARLLSPACGPGAGHHRAGDQRRRQRHARSEPSTGATVSAPRAVATPSSGSPILT